ncbi:unnamed protein product [Phaeothamnion confervicola]
MASPTYDALCIDDNLTQLERVVRYSSSSIALQRLVHVKMLAETTAAVGFEETARSIVPLLAQLAADEEYVVRQHLGEQIDEVARLVVTHGKEAGYRLVVERVLPLLYDLLADAQAEVRQTAGEALVGVAALMRPGDLGTRVLTFVLQNLAHDDEKEELRMTAAGLLNDLAECLGPDLCREFVTPEMLSLSEDPVFRVRKATALNLHHVCRVVAEADAACVADRLLPAYVRLTKDDMYRVRKACTESLVEISKAVGPDVAHAHLSEVFLRLASDNSKLVRNGALQHLGPFISTLRREKVSSELVRLFVGAALERTGDPQSCELVFFSWFCMTRTLTRHPAGNRRATDATSEQVDDELRLYCAFSFPAVVLTLGPARWPELRDAFLSLSKDADWNVRKTLSHSLHEIAKARQ